MDWEAIGASLRRRKAETGYAEGGLEHGYFFLLLEDIRGYANAIFQATSTTPDWFVKRSSTGNANPAVPLIRSTASLPGWPKRAQESCRGFCSAPVDCRARPPGCTFA